MFNVLQYYLNSTYTMLFPGLCFNYSLKIGLLGNNYCVTSSTCFINMVISGGVERRGSVNHRPSRVATVGMHYWHVLFHTYDSTTLWFEQSRQDHLVYYIHHSFQTKKIRGHIFSRNKVKVTMTTATWVDVGGAQVRPRRYLLLASCFQHYGKPCGQAFSIHEQYDARGDSSVPKVWKSLKKSIIHYLLLSIYLKFGKFQSGVVSVKMNGKYYSFPVHYTINRNPSRTQVCVQYENLIYNNMNSAHFSLRLIFLYVFTKTYKISPLYPQSKPTRKTPALQVVQMFTPY